MGSEPWHTWPIIKLWERRAWLLPNRPKEPRYPEALALNTSPPVLWDDTTFAAGFCHEKPPWYKQDFSFLTPRPSLYLSVFVSLSLPQSPLQRSSAASHFPGGVGATPGLVTWQPEETASATIDIFPILLACLLPFSGHLIDSDSLYWVFHMKENLAMKC